MWGVLVGVGAGLTPQISAAAPSGEPEAIARYAALEAKLLAAPVVKVDCRLASTGSFEATLVVALETKPDRRAQLTMQGDLLGRPAQLELRSDGQTLRWAGRKLPVPPDLHRGLLLGFTRVGLLYNVIALATGRGPEGTDGKVEHWLEVEALRLGPEEQVDGHATSKLEFDLHMGKEKAGHVELWIDRESGLPVKRASVVDFQGTMTVVERYRAVSLGGDAPARRGAPERRRR